MPKYSVSGHARMIEERTSWLVMTIEADNEIEARGRFIDFNGDLESEQVGDAASLTMGETWGIEVEPLLDPVHCCNCGTTVGPTEPDNCPFDIELDGTTHTFCLSCKEAFEWGQARPEEDFNRAKITCPRCGTDGCEADFIADHGRCRDCHKSWQHGEDYDEDVQYCDNDMCGTQLEEGRSGHCDSCIEQAARATEGNDGV